MTTTRIDHTGHNHPATAAARKICRNELRTADAAISAHYTTFPVVAPISGCNLDMAHCSACGSTDDLDGDEGYTACCNQRVENGSFYCAGNH